MMNELHEIIWKWENVKKSRFNDIIYPQLSACDLCHTMFACIICVRRMHTIISYFTLDRFENIPKIAAYFVESKRSKNTGLQGRGN